MKKFLTVIVIAAAIIGGGAYWYKSSATNGKEKREVAAVARGDLVVSVSASGAVEPSFQVEVKSKASGEILKFDYEPGDRVEKGATLLTLDRRTEKRNLAQKEADLARVMSELDSAKANLLEKTLSLKRMKQLFGKKLVSDQDLDLATAARAMAKARIGEIDAAAMKARLAVEDARERLDETVILSPIDGVIIEKTVERGQIISSGITSVTGGNKLCVIADLSRLFVYAMVDETDIGKVKAGQNAQITVDAYPSKPFEGVVKRIYPTGETSDNITVFKVKVEVLDSEREMLRPKMTANVDMIVEKRANVLIIPDEAVRPKDDGFFVYAFKNGKVTKKDVKTGETNGFETEITEGLDEGDTILLKAPRSNDKGRRS